MYLDAMEFLEEERDAWAAYEALADLTDEQLDLPIEAAHGWSGRDLMAHYARLAGRFAGRREGAGGRRDERHDRAVDADWETRAGGPSTTTSRGRGRDPDGRAAGAVPDPAGELRGYLTVVPEARWVKHAAHLKSFHDETIAHYADHATTSPRSSCAAGG
jgi:hypothetical protein